MRIRYQSRHGIGRVECRDFLGNDLTIWAFGQEREIPDDRVIVMRRADGRKLEMNAVDAVLSLGPDFVDAATGVNPFFQCVKCGAATTAESFLAVASNEGTVLLADEHGDRLCLHCYIAANPDREANFRALGMDEAIIAEGQRRGGREPNGRLDPGTQTHAEQRAAFTAAADPTYDPTGDRYRVIMGDAASAPADALAAILDRAPVDDEPTTAAELAAIAEPIVHSELVSDPHPDSEA